MKVRLTVTVSGPTDAVYCGRCHWLVGVWPRRCELFQQRLTAIAHLSAYRCQRCHLAQERTRAEACR
jgi:hypothetical protein